MKQNFHKLYWPIFVFGVIALTLLQYYGLIRYHYPVPPGHDAMMHWNMIQPYYEGKLTFIEAWRSGGYPPLFQISTSWLAHVFHIDPMQVMLWTTPSIIVFSALSLFVFTYQAFGKYPALITFFLYGFTGKIAQQQLNDGGYPNLISAQVFIPLAFLFLILFFKSKKYLKAVNLFLFFVFLTLVVLTHHVATLYLLAIFLIASPIFLIYSWRSNEWKPTSGIFVSLILILFYGFLFYLYLDTDLFAPIRSLSDSMIQIQNSFPYFKLVGTPDPEALLSIKSYPRYIGEAIFILGVLGIFLLPLIFKNNIRKYFLSLLLIITWALILLIGSRFKFVTNPDRFVRDLIAPLSILAGVLIFYGLNYFLVKKNRVGIAISIVTTLLISLYPLAYRVKSAISYEPMVRITDADITAINYLKSQNPGRILIEDYSFYFDYFLPDWSINYLWIPSTQQQSNTRPLNPNNPLDSIRLMEYDYVYVADSQKGWTPQAVQFGFAKKYLNSSNFEVIGNYQSQTNSIYLFKTIK